MTNTPPTGTTPTPAVTQDPNAITAATNATVANNQALSNQNTLLTQNAEYMSTLNDNMSIATVSLRLLGDFINKGASAFSNLSDNVSQYMDQINSSAGMTTSSMNKMGLAITAVVGASEPFKNWQADGLTTFSSQIGDLVTAAGDSSDTLNSLANSLGITIPDAVKGSAEALGNFIKNTASAADYSLKAQDVYIKMAAKTGELGTSYLNLSDNAGHMNAMVANQISQFTQASKATNISIDDAQKYYVALKAIPGAMMQMNEAQAHAMGGVSDLTKTIQLAKGLGRDYADVVNDMKEAVVNYNASIPDAMEFTERLSEISNNYHIRLEDVQKSVMGTTDALKMFGYEGQSVTDIMNKYVGALEQTGISGAVASDIVGNMTRQIGQLTIAQKGFLSAQSGGPGGLQGAFQIDNLLRQKDGLQKVFEMTKNQMTKMMGPLVTTEQAANSPQAAAQMTKQIMMLKQGPLGQFARTDQEAERIIEAFKSGNSHDFKELAKGSTGVDAATKVGNDLAKQSNTYLKSIRDLIAESRGEAASSMIDLYQSGSTAGAGKEMDDYNNQTIQDQRAFLSGNMEEGARSSAGPNSGVRVMNDFAKTMADAPTAVKAAFEGVSKALTPEGASDREQKLSDFLAQQEARKNEANTLPPAMKEMELQNIKRSEESMKALVSSVGATNMQGKDKGNDNDLPSFIKPQTSELGVPINSGHQVGVAASANASRAASAAAHANAPGQIAPHTAHAGGASPGPLGEILVKVEGYCIHCQEKIAGSQHAESVSVGSKVR